MLKIFIKRISIGKGGENDDDSNVGGNDLDDIQVKYDGYVMKSTIIAC